MREKNGNGKRTRAIQRRDAANILIVVTLIVTFALVHYYVLFHFDDGT